MNHTTPLSLKFLLFWQNSTMFETKVLKRPWKVPEEQGAFQTGDVNIYKSPNHWCSIHQTCRLTLILLKTESNNPRVVPHQYPVPLSLMEFAFEAGGDEVSQLREEALHHQVRQDLQGKRFPHTNKRTTSALHFYSRSCDHHGNLSLYVFHVATCKEAEHNRGTHTGHVRWTTARAIKFSSTEDNVRWLCFHQTKSVIT